MRALLAILATAILPLSSVQAAGPKAYTISPGPSLRYATKACGVQFVLANTYSSTLEVSGRAYLVTLDKTTIGSTLLFFGPALVGGKSVATAIFPASTYAPDGCPRQLRRNGQD
jgi:hypothetical protein